MAGESKHRLKRPLEQRPKPVEQSTVADAQIDPPATIKMEIDMECRCGSGEPRRALYDARGIFCTYVCDRCETERRKEFRSEVFADANYSHEEPIDDA